MMKKTITLLLPTLNEVTGFKAIFPKIDTSLLWKVEDKSWEEARKEI